MRQTKGGAAKGEALARAALLVLLALAALVWFFLPGAQQDVRGLAMLFTQKSALTLAGAVRSSGAPVVSAVLYMVFQTLVLPHLPPLMYIANTTVFGPVGGVVITLLGSALSASACFWVARLLLRPLLRRLKPPAPTKGAQQYGVPLFVAARWLLLGWWAPLCYLAGFLGIKYTRFLPGAMAAQLPVLVLYAVYCNVYTATLPLGIRMGCTVAGAGVLIGIVLVIYKRKRRNER